MFRAAAYKTTDANYMRTMQVLHKKTCEQVTHERFSEYGTFVADRIRYSVKVLNWCGEECRMRSYTT